jgi:glucose/arabinose dehydrogenase
MGIGLRAVSAMGSLLVFPVILSAQVTHGQKPQLPAPYTTKSAGNGPRNDTPPPGFLPTVPKGFQINVYASDFKVPRWLTVAPNGDIFLAETGANQIVVMRDPQNTGGAQQREIFATGTRRVFGIAFKDDYVYVGDTNELVRFRYDPKTSKRLGEGWMAGTPGCLAPDCGTRSDWRSSP